jgi:hypothetical protein
MQSNGPHPQVVKGIDIATGIGGIVDISIVNIVDSIATGNDMTVGIVNRIDSMANISINGIELY